MIIIYKNISDTYVVRQSVRVDPNEEYNIPSVDQPDWAADDEVLNDITNEVASIGNGTTFYETTNEQINYLKGLDTDVHIKSADVNIPIEQKGFVDLTGYNLYRKGYNFTATAGEETEFEASYDSNMKLQGLAYKLNNSSWGDYVEVEIADSDGIYYPEGTVLAKFAETEYVWEDKEFECVCPDTKTIPTGIYVRFRYVSNNATSGDVNVILVHILRTMPS